jgi:hypothetical protein
MENLGIYETYMHFGQISYNGKKAPVLCGIKF